MWNQASVRSLLNQASFGKRVAEDEAEGLATYFVETDQWRSLWRGDCDVILGPKGSGKSALYSLLVQRSNLLFDRGIFAIAAENPSGVPAFREILAEPPTSEANFTGLWKLYFLSLVANVLREYDVRTDDANIVYESLEHAGLMDLRGGLGARVRAILEYIHRVAGSKEIEGSVSVDPHTAAPVVSGRIVLGEPGQRDRAQGMISIDELLRNADRALAAVDISIWILLDRLDVAFEMHPSLERNALRALFKAYLDIKGLKRIGLKIFLRNDIWDRIAEGGFREASHISAELTLHWDSHGLLQLITRRVLTNDAIADFYRVEPKEVFRNVAQQRQLLERVMPILSDTGGQSILDWVVAQATDATGQPAPRELIHLFSAARVRQLERLEIGYPLPPREELFDRIAIKEAVADVSEVRLKRMLYAEHPDVKPFVTALEGGKTVHTLDTLACLWEVDADATKDVANRLITVGFFRRSGDRRSPTYEIGQVYRPSLGIVRGRAKPPVS